MKNICFFVSNINESGGVERVCSIIAENLSQDNEVNVTVLSLFEGKVPHYCLGSDVGVFSLYSEKPNLKSTYIKTLIDLRSYVIDNDIDVLISVESTMSLFSVPSLIFTKCKLINWEHFNFKVTLGNNYRAFGRFLAACFGDVVVTLTERDKFFWESKKYTRSKIISIPNPSMLMRKEVDNKIESKKIISIGRLTDQKGFDMLLLAWSIVNNVHPEWKLNIIGDGEEHKNLCSLVSKLNIEDCVQILPFSNEIESHYESAYAYVMSSRYEGLPMVLLEAMSFGLPLVSFDCDTGPAELIEDEKNGFLVKPNNSQELAESIIDLIELDNIKYLEFSNYSKVKSQQFDLSIILNKWKEIIGEL